MKFLFFIRATFSIILVYRENTAKEPTYIYICRDYKVTRRDMMEIHDVDSAYTVSHKNK